MKMQSLNGQWRYRIGKGVQTVREVPFSAVPVGHSECERNFKPEYTSDKVFLKFDGITYYAKITLNGVIIGEMLPYSEYMFDITDIISPDDNELKVELEDISPDFGPSEGWENYGGIIRDVNIIYTGNDRIDDVFFHCELENDYKDASFVVETVAIGNAEEYNITLSYMGDDIISYKQSVGGEFAREKISDVKLWSPDSPELYDLKVELLSDGNIVDTYSCKVGFREFTCDRHRFILNGEPLYLMGVCKHEMFGDSGHTPTEDEIRRDLEMIKKTGCNFVRLVHYPHNKKTLQIADSIGLMVSEEPGLWWSDTANPNVSEGSLEVLRRTIRRDRNHPSVVFWLCFNECRFTEQFLIDSARVCRECDPTRMVSGANCMNDEETLKYFNICGFDFYTMHPYDRNIDRSKNSAKVLYDKPLLFTEWGGYHIYNNPKLLSEFMLDMYKMYLSNADGTALAGSFIWEWSEVFDYNRGEPACYDGNLREGIVDRYRNPGPHYEAFCKAIYDMKHPKTYDFWFDGDADRYAKKSAVNISEGDAEELCGIITKINETDAQNRKKMRKRRLKKGPILENINGLLNVPLIISDDVTHQIECDICADELEIVGMSSLTKGYPLSGEYGEQVLKMTLCFEDGETKEIGFKNGEDVTTVFETLGSSLIDPIAENAERVAAFGYDKNFERYVMNSIKVKIESEKAIKKIILISSDNGYSTLVYGIFSK